MHYSEPTPAPTPGGLPWYKELNRYHWWILIICILGWTFDTMDQRLFILARGDAMASLCGPGVDQGEAGRGSTMWFIYGWATGGLVFGVLGDKIGRAKTMMLTILVYAVFTAGSGFAHNLLTFNIFRFLTGLGVGGEFAAGVALLSEVIPERARPHALGLMQSLSAVGNITGSLIQKSTAYFHLDWRAMFFIGAFPALLVVLIRLTVKEPDTWVRAKADAKLDPKKQLGSYFDLLASRRWRKNAIIGMLIGTIGVTGLWGITFYTPELLKEAIGSKVSPDQMKQLKANMLLFQDIGGLISMYGFAVVASRIGRRATFALCSLAGFASVMIVFGFLSDPSQIWWMGFILGFGSLAYFGGFAVYFPELFPTRMRSTGVSLCYNVARYGAAYIQFKLPMYIYDTFFKEGYTPLEGYRATNMTFASVYLIGLIVLIFAPETKGKPLPTDDDEPEAVPA